MHGLTPHSATVLVGFPEGESLIMKIISVIVMVLIIGTNSQVSRIKRSSSGFIYDASAHLSANYFNEDRKGIEDSGGYLKGPYRKVIEYVN